MGSLETALAFILLASPVWWVSGCGIFIYHAAVAAAMIHILVQCAIGGRPLQIPKLLLWFVFFLVIYIFSITANAGSNASQRTFASLNNYSTAVMAFLIVFVVYQCDFKKLLSKTLNSARLLCAVSGIMGAVILVLWCRGIEIEWTSPLGRAMPSLLNYPYFFSLLSLAPTLLDQFAGLSIPRLALFSRSATGTGGVMVMLVPLMAAYYRLNSGKRVEFAAVLGLSLLTLFFSLSRSAIAGLLVGWLMVVLLQKGKKLLVILIAAGAVALALGLLNPAIEWLLNSRKASTVGRMEVYEEAFRLVTRESLWIGMGARLRDDFTMRAIGSHALIVEVFFVTGLLGLLTFAGFQVLVMLSWYRQQKLLQTGEQRVIWKYLGISLLSTNLWLLTDTFFAMPMTAYAYFLVTGFILAFGRELKQTAQPENLPPGPSALQDRF